MVKKSDNSASVRIPAAVMEAAHLRLDQAGDLRHENSMIIIEPMLEESPDLTRLLAGITDDNLHDAIDFGAPVGRDVW